MPTPARARTAARGSPPGWLPVVSAAQSHPWCRRADHTAPRVRGHRDHLAGDRRAALRAPTGSARSASGRQNRSSPAATQAIARARDLGLIPW